MQKATEANTPSEKEVDVNRETELETCHSCNGSGREVICGLEQPCDRCSGDGAIPKDRT